MSGTKELFVWTHVVTEAVMVRPFPPFTGTLSDQQRPVMELAPGTKVMVVREARGWVALNLGQNLWIPKSALKQKPDHHA